MFVLTEVFINHRIQTCYEDDTAVAECVRAMGDNGPGNRERVWEEKRKRDNLRLKPRLCWEEKNLHSIFVCVLL